MALMAAIQMCSSTCVQNNLSIAKNLIQEAVQQGAKLVVLPEMFATFGMNETERNQAKEEYGTGPIQEFLADQAYQNKLWIVGGTIPLSCSDDNKARAACLVFNNEGHCVGRYDKIHMFDVRISATEVYQESDLTQAGESMTVIDTPFGKLGLAVCYDIRFPELFRHLISQGVEIFAVPAAFTVKTGKAHWQLLARSRAVENFCYFIGAGQGGAHSNGRETYGHSLIVDPWGAVMAEMDSTSSGVICQEIDLNYLHEIRQSMRIHPL